MYNISKLIFESDCLKYVTWNIEFIKLSNLESDFSLNHSKST